MKIINLTNANQLPAWIYAQLPGETVERTAARLEKQHGRAPQTVYFIGGHYYFDRAELEPKHAETQTRTD